MTTWPFPSRQTAPIARALPRPGNGVRLSLGAGGFAYSTAAAGATFDAPWRPALNGFRISLRRGMINGIFEPAMNVNGTQVPMSGNAQTPLPQIVLAAAVANAAGESWLALEVEPNAKGEIDTQSRIEIVHTATPVSHALTLARKPLTLILWKGGRPLRADPLVHFNMNYTRIVDALGTRHFFT